MIYVYVRYKIIIYSCVRYKLYNIRTYNVYSSSVITFQYYYSNYKEKKHETYKGKNQIEFKTT